MNDDLERCAYQGQECGTPAAPFTHWCAFGCGTPPVGVPVQAEDEPTANARPHDMVTRPAHYTAGAVECIDAIRSALGDDAFAAFCRGNVIKYSWRAGLKGPPTQDALKAAFYARMAAHVGDPAEHPDPRTVA